MIRNHLLCLVLIMLAPLLHAQQPETNFEKALSDFERIADIRKSLLGGNDTDYAATLKDIAYCHSRLGNYDKALQYYREASEIYKSNLGVNHPDYASTLSDIGYCHSRLGDYGKALEYLGEAAEIRREALGESHPDYATSLNNIGGCYSVLGDYGKALEYHMKAADIRKAAFGGDHPDYAASLNNIGGCYSDLRNYAKALEFYQEASDILKSVFGENHPDYATSLNNIGYCQSRLGNYGKALEFYQKASGILKSVFGESHPDYATTINNIGYCHSRMGDNGKALELYQESLRIRKSFLGERHPDCVAPLRGIGICDLNLHDYQSATDVFNEFYSLMTSNVLDAFGYLTRISRLKYWNMCFPYFQYQLPVLSLVLKSYPSFLQTAYNGLIFSKGLLLNAETEMRDLILESGDTEVLDIYDRFSRSRQQLAKEYERPIPERRVPTDSLEAVCDALEKELMQKSKAYGDYTRNLSLKWTDVQSGLNDNDIAIEFMKIPVARDTIKYCALTLKKDYDSPHFVQLFDLKDFKALSKITGPTDIYANPELYNLVWRPLENELEGIENIYFGPSGVLYRTAIEYADNGNGPLSEQKNIYRLSSTRQIATIKEKGDEKTAAIYGGLQYGTSMETLIADSRNYPLRSMDEDFFFSVDSLDLRGMRDGLGADDLPATLTEASDIAGTMDEAHYEKTLNTGEKGTETSFKALSGQRKRIIHVATHGFYWTGDEAERVGRLLGRQELLGSDNDHKVREDKSLSRSGLLFAGANNALNQGYRKTDGVDDGILTAKEIAGMDLRGTDLVVLSACQTGLGEVSGEGVFGLQRGFKKAGANALLMSLWKVDDEATSLLMREFYNNCLTKGLDLQRSLHEAQRTVREYECEEEVEENGDDSLLISRLNNGGEDDSQPAEATKVKVRKFENPRYWAGFILLDAIN